jgi:sterol desaturase/sphingolipid hydroxylase (fatty acid hydroxylase superfamily)
MITVNQLPWGTGPLWLVLLLWWETLNPFLPLFNNGWRSRCRHGLRNVAVALFNSGMTALLFVGLWTTIANWAERASFGILNLYSLPVVGHAVLAVLLLDFWTYWWHRLNHRFPFFWRFHRAHHSDAQMDVTTASRFHVGEIFFSSCLRVPLIRLVGIHLWEITVYETMLLAVIQFHHANLDLPPRLDQMLRCVIVTPAMHTRGARPHNYRTPVKSGAFVSLSSTRHYVELLAEYRPITRALLVHWHFHWHSLLQGLDTGYPSILD